MNPGLTQKCSPLSIPTHCSFPLNITGTFIGGAQEQRRRGPRPGPAGPRGRSWELGEAASTCTALPAPHHLHTSGLTACTELSSREPARTSLTWDLIIQALPEDTPHTWNSSHMTLLQGTGSQHVSGHLALLICPENHLAHQQEAT